MENLDYDRFYGDMLKKNDDRAWKWQDLAMARTLRDYGFTSVARISGTVLRAGFDGGEPRYDVPFLCFENVKPGETREINALIAECEERCL